MYHSVCLPPAHPQNIYKYCIQSIDLLDMFDHPKSRECMWRHQLQPACWHDNKPHWHKKSSSACVKFGPFYLEIQPCLPKSQAPISTWSPALPTWKPSPHSYLESVPAYLKAKPKPTRSPTRHTGKPSHHTYLSPALPIWKPSPHNCLESSPAYLKAKPPYLPGVQPCLPEIQAPIPTWSPALPTWKPSRNQPGLPRSLALPTWKSSPAYPKSNTAIWKSNPESPALFTWKSRPLLPAFQSVPAFLEVDPVFPRSSNANLKKSSLV